VKGHTSFPPEIMSNKKRRLLGIVLVVFLIVGFETFIAFPPSNSNAISKLRPIILYFDYGYPTFQISQFPDIVNFTLQHGFNTLMMVVFKDHKSEFNMSTIKYFISYSKSRGLTYVPSYYIESLADQINVSGLTWVNLDMERMDPTPQSVYYNNVAKLVPFVSVTSPYGQQIRFHTPLNIVETYSGWPWFWLMQFTYYHPGKICSVGVWLMKSESEYDAQKSYCLKYTGGVMVFDYSNLLRLGYK
jgi:hypothetical protein